MRKPTIDPKILQHIDDQMQKGYEYSTIENKINRVKVWLELWQDLKRMLDEKSILSMRHLDEARFNSESIMVWADDFESELHDVAQENLTYHSIRITFCEEYIAHSYKIEDSNALDMLLRIVETYYFDEGNYEEIDRLFESFLGNSPRNGGGWIAWADQYSFKPKSANKDYEKATRILLNALKVRRIEAKLDVLDRLADVYRARGMETKEIKIREKIQNEIMKELFGM